MVGVDATMVEVNSAPHRETMEALWERVLKCWSQNGLNRGRDCQSPRRLGSGLRGLMDTNQEKILPRATGDYPPDTKITSTVTWRVIRRNCDSGIRAPPAAM